MVSRDARLDHPAIRAYREICRLTPNHFQRGEIVTTFIWGTHQLGTEERALVEWMQILRIFMREGRPPQRVDWIMDRFEERVRKIA